MELRLTSEEAELLEHIVEAQMHQLQFELARVDEDCFKSILKKKEQLLGSLLNKFSAQAVV